MHPLDNPIWSALTGRQKDLADRHGNAARFHPNLSPLSATADESRSAFEDLARISNADQPAVLFAKNTPPPGWEVLVDEPLIRMDCDREPVMPSNPGLSPVPLIEEHVPQMLDLVALTEPGPFEQETIKLGRFVGVFEDNTLIAMAGERLALEGHREVSAVCTHPQHQGRGLAKFLTATVAKRIRDDGDTPFLHRLRNSATAAAAKRTYESIGFVEQKVSRVIVTYMIE